MSLLMRDGFDPDAWAYIQAVESADGQKLESGVRRAIGRFVRGCKDDGIWGAIKASCILAGARTLSGALVPLVGSAPTSFNFVSGDYNRISGLKGDKTTKYLASNYSFPTSLQNNCHISANYTSKISNSSPIVGACGAGGSTHGSYLQMDGTRLYNEAILAYVPSDTTTLGFRGVSRNNSSNFNYYAAKASEIAPIPSFVVTHINQYVFARNNNGTVDAYRNGSINFYSIGEFMDLARLDTRVTQLMTDISNALS